MKKLGGWVLFVLLTVGVALIVLAVYVVMQTTQEPSIQGEVFYYEKPLEAPAGGFLLPSESSIPAGFKKTEETYRKQSYEEMYTNQETIKLLFEEKDYGDNFDFERKEAENPRTGPFTRMDFKFKKEPGSVYTYRYSDSESLYLIYHDGRKTLMIRVSHVPHGKYTPQTLIDILSTMVRS